MGESEYIDLFQGNNGENNNLEQMAYQFDQEIYNPGRSRINDYKHSSSTIHKGNLNLNQDPNMNAGANGRPEKKKSYLNISDERIVWAGAIFVFFGVFVFLIGYWLGKTTLKDITFSNKQQVQAAEEKLDQKKTENLMASGLSPLTESIRNDTASADSVKDKASTELPEGASLISPNSRNEKMKTITAPPISAAKIEVPKLKLTATSMKKNNKTSAVTAPKAASVRTATPGRNYTLQISAHTSMEKARFVEDNLRRAGFQSYLAEASVNGVTYYRVRVGKFGSKQAAQSALAKIKSTSKGKDSFILNLN